MKMYEFRMKSGNTTYTAIVTEPNFENGILRAVQVGHFDGFNKDGGYNFTACEHREFIAGGGPYTLVEYKKELNPAVTSPFL